MNTKFCTCGAKTFYTITAPRFCNSCGKEFASLFGSISQPSTTKQVIKNPVQQKYNRPTRPSTTNQDENDEYVSKNEIQEQAQILLNEINASECGIIVPPKEQRGYKLSDVLDPTKNIEIGIREDINTSNNAE